MNDNNYWTRNCKTKETKYDIHCFSLVCWQNGWWSIDVTDDWHEWMKKGIEIPRGLYETPEEACEGFLKFVNKNKIKLSSLQSKE